MGMATCGRGAVGLSNTQKVMIVPNRRIAIPPTPTAMPMMALVESSRWVPAVGNKRKQISNTSFIDLLPGLWENVQNSRE